MRYVLAGVLTALFASDTILAQASGQRADAVEQYFESVGLGASQLRAVERGQAVVRLLDTEDNRDVAVVGAIRVPASRDDVVARALELRGAVVTGASQFGAFGDPPTAEDVRDVRFDRSEYKGLRNCRPGDCDFKLSASAMTAFATGVAWSSPNAKAQADDLLRDSLVRLVADYRRRGNAAMPTYDDGRSVQSADAFAAVLAQSSQALGAHAPLLLRYLTTYPSDPPDGAHDYVDWVEERRPHTRPTLTVNHVVVYAPPGGPAFIARKQIYATHYFEAALELVAVIDADNATPSAPASYLITLRRYRFDYLPGGILNVRGRVKGRLVDATRSDLIQERTAIAARRF